MVPAPDLAAWLRGASSTFITTLAGLAFETIPFLLMGTLLSSLIQSFVPDRALRRIFPKNRYLSMLVALFAGVFVPICECGTVPLARRLRQKGLPLSTAVAFLLAAPLANPMTDRLHLRRVQGHRLSRLRLRLGSASPRPSSSPSSWSSSRRSRPRIDIDARRGDTRRLDSGASRPRPFPRPRGCPRPGEIAGRSCRECEGDARACLLRLPRYGPLSDRRHFRRLSRQGPDSRRGRSSARSASPLRPRVPASARPISSRSAPPPTPSSRDRSSPPTPILQSSPSSCSAR